MMDFMLIFDLVIAGLGLYLIYSSLKMRQTGELSTIVVNQADMARCRDKGGFIEIYIYRIWIKTHRWFFVLKMTLIQKN